VTALERAKELALGWKGARPCVNCRASWGEHVRAPRRTCANYAPMDAEQHMRAVFRSCIAEVEIIDETGGARDVHDDDTQGDRGDRGQRGIR